jgi:hypothetical protein
MKVLSCAVARRRLQAYHDDELAVRQRIEVDAHVDLCDPCREALDDLGRLGSALRMVTPGRFALSAEEQAGLHASIVGRVGAEQRMALSVRVREIFEDMHFVYAGLGAVGATVSCIAIMLSMMNFAALTNPGFNQNPVVVDARMLMPRALYGFDAPAPPVAADDGAFTLSAVVTREGRLVNLEVYPEDGVEPKAGSREARAVESLLGAMSQARFEPARVAGLPIAVNMVWLVTHTTVRGTEMPKVEPEAPASKKRSEASAPQAPPHKPVVA